MDNTDELAKKIYARVKSMDIDDDDIAFLIKSHWDEGTRIVKNINETSLSESDRIKRIIEFESKYSLSKTHII